MRLYARAAKFAFRTCVASAATAVLGLVACSASGAVTVQIGTTTGNAVDLVEIPVTLATGGVEVAGVQVDLQLPPDLTIPATGLGRPDCTVNAAIQKDGTSFAYQPSGCDPNQDCTGVRALVLALDNNDPIADGTELFRCRVQIATAEAGLPIVCGNSGANDPNGNPVATTCAPGGVVIVDHTPSTTPSTRTPTPTRTPTSTPRDPVMVQIGTAAGNALDLVEIPVTLTTGGVEVAGVQVDLNLPPDLTIPATGLGRPDCTVNPAIQKNGTSFTYQPSGCDPTQDCTGVRALVHALNNVDPIADGELFRCRVQIATTAETGLLIGCSNSGASEPNGNGVATTCAPGGVVIASHTPSTPTATVTETATPTRTLTRTPTPTQREPVTVQIGTAAGNAVDLVEIPVTLITGGVAVAGVQVDLQLPPDLTIPATGLGRPDCTVNPAIQKDGTSFVYLPFGCDPTQNCTSVRATVLDFDNVIPIADGAELFRCRAQIATAEAGLPIGCANAGASDPNGGPVTTTCAPGGVVIVSHTRTPTATDTETATPTRTPTRTPTSTPRDPATVQIGTAAGNALDLVEIPVTLTTDGVELAQVHVDFSLPPDLTIPATGLGRPDCTVNPAIQKNGTSFAYQPSGCDPNQDCTGVRALVLALDNVDPIADGELFRCRVQIATTAETQLLIGCGNSGASDPNGNAVATTCTPGGVVIVSHTPSTPTATVTETATPTPTLTRTPTPTQREPVTVQIGTAASNAVDLVEIPVTLITGGVAVAGVQVDLQLPPDLTIPATGLGRPDCTVNPAIQKDGTSFVYLPFGCDPTQNCTSVRANVLALDNVIPIADGAELFRCRAQIATAEAGLPIGCANAGASDPNGGPVTTTCAPGGVVIVSHTPSTPIATDTETATPTATPSPSPTATQTPFRCVGDCDGNGSVEIAELIRGVNIALGSTPLADCHAFDRTGDGEVGVFELINAVSNALTGCVAPSAGVAGDPHVVGD